MKLLYVTKEKKYKSDFLQLLMSTNTEVTHISSNELCLIDINDYHYFVFDGTGTNEGLKFYAPEQEIAEKIISTGKHVFSIFCPFLWSVSCGAPTSTRYDRPIFTGNSTIDGLEECDILDEQSNLRLHCYASKNATNPILYYKHLPKGFYKISEAKKNVSNDEAALWLESENLLYCTFCISNFAKAAFSPRKTWYSLFKFIIKWLCGETVCESNYEKIYRENGYYFEKNHGNFEKSLEKSAKKAIKWHEKSDMFIYKDKKIFAVNEGIGGGVLCDGTRSTLYNYTTEANGETAFAHYISWLYTGEKHEHDVYEACYEYVKAHIGSYKNGLDGYARSGDCGWWYTCYSDDAARAVVYPELFISLLENRPIDERIIAALDFLVRTTGNDGLRFVRTDIVDAAAEKMSTFALIQDGTKWNLAPGPVLTIDQFKDIPAKTPSAHYSGYYLATMLLAYKATGNEVYKNIGLNGINTLMSYYPHTAREHSETQDNARLILPLAYRYWITKSKKDKDDLFKIVLYFENLLKDKGGFIEWDSDYSAVCAGTENTESSVLSQNGDPVCDLLYSLNWLPMAFIHSYFITNDERFLTLYKQISVFLTSIQIKSKNKMIDGAWARGYDINTNEVYGVPNDVGWSPWSIECGWIMGQIPMGFYMWLMKDKIKKIFE